MAHKKKRANGVISLQEIVECNRTFGKLTRRQIQTMADGAVVKFTPVQLNNFFNEAYRMVVKK